MSFPLTRTIAHLVLAAALAAGSASAIAAPSAEAAEAAAPAASATAARSAAGVSITPITRATAPYRKRAVVRPRYRASGQVAVSDARLTVSRAGRTIATNRRSVSIPPGTYRVTQRVTYRTYTLRSSRATVVPAGARFESYDYVYGQFWSSSCSVTAWSPDGAAPGTGTGTLGCEVFSDEGLTASFTYPFTYDGSTLRTEGDRVAGVVVPGSEPAVGDGVYFDSLLTTAPITRPASVRVYGGLRSVKRTSTLRVKAGAKPRTCATYADFQRVSVDFAEPELYGDSMAVVAATLHNGGKRSTYSDYGDSVIEFRRYRTCAKGAILSVGFFNGDAYAKSYLK